MHYLTIFLFFLIGSCNPNKTCGPWSDEPHSYTGSMMLTQGNGAAHININGTSFALSLHDQGNYRTEVGNIIDLEAKKSKFNYSFAVLKINAKIYFKTNKKGKCSFHIRKLDSINIVNDESIIEKEYLTFFNAKPF